MIELDAPLSMYDALHEPPSAPYTVVFIGLPQIALEPLDTAAISFLSDRLAIATALADVTISVHAMDAQQPDAETSDAETSDAEHAMDGRTAADQGLDASPSGDLGRRWLASVAFRASAFCHCEVAVRDYESVQECSLAEGALAVSSCAGSALVVHTSLHAAFACVADGFEAQASCIGL